MTAQEKANWLVNECYYQPITLHLNVSNNSKEMWEYAKRCARICVEEILNEQVRVDYLTQQVYENQKAYWQTVLTEIEKL